MAKPVTTDACASESYLEHVEDRAQQYIIGETGNFLDRIDKLRGFIVSHWKLNNGW